MFELLDVRPRIGGKRNIVGRTNQFAFSFLPLDLGADWNPERACRGFDHFLCRTIAQRDSPRLDVFPIADHGAIGIEHGYIDRETHETGVDG